MSFCVKCGSKLEGPFCGTCGNSVDNQFTPAPEPLIKLAVLDTETTGVYNADRIIEIGIIVMEFGSFKRVDSFETLINPKRDVGPTSIHGITATMVHDAPTFEDVAYTLTQHLKGCVLVAHNLAFDQRMLINEFKRIGVEFDPGKGICTMRRCGGSLEAACDVYGIQNSSAHRAKSDANAAAQLLVASLTEEANATGEVSIKLTPADVVSSKTFGQSAIRTLTRDDVPTPQPLVATQRAHFPVKAEDREILPYLEILKKALADSVLTNEESMELSLLARDLGLTEQQISHANREGFRSHVAQLVASGTLPLIDEIALNGCASRLGVEQGKSVTNSSDQSERLSSIATDQKSVCFTGDISIGGEFYSHDQLAIMARTADWSVETSVTKKRCSLLVAGDVMSESGKANKARQFGISIIDGDGYAALLEPT